MKRFLLAICFLTAYLISEGQSVSAGADRYFCSPVTTQLQGSGSDDFFYFRWHPANLVSDSTILNPTTTVNTTTTFRLQGYYEDLSVVYHGDFEGMGNGPFSNIFTSSYTNNQTSVWNESTYAITSNAHNVHSNFASLYDHTTGNSSGHYMVVNGAVSPNATVWQQSIGIMPNTLYIFYTWVCTLHDDGAAALARLQFSINNQLIGSVFTAPCLVADGWQQFYTTWNSGNNTTATIRIVNQNTTGSGNDFGIDDIHFAPLVPVEDSMTVHIFGGSSAYDTVHICYNESFDFMGNMLAEPGDYVDTLPIQFGDVMCDSILHLHLTKGDEVSVELGNDRYFCSSEATEYVLNAGGDFFYEWSTGETERMITVNETNTYHVTVSDDHDCTASDSISVTFETTPTVQILNQTENFCDGYTAELYADGNAENFLWSTGNSEQAITVHAPGSYSVEARNGECRSIATCHIEDCAYEFYLPNAFTPNGDGLNDVFYLNNTEDIVEFDICIYNRWGELVFHTLDPNFGWDGTRNGNIVPDGVYNYVIKLVIKTGKPYLLKGQIVVLSGKE